MSLARIRFGLALVSLCLTPSAFAFPELTKHGYPNCVACHVSPTGGGNLTQYGRATMGQVLTTFSRKDEGNFVFADPPDWLLLGGDLRTLNIQNETQSGAKVNRLILMQADVEGAVVYKQFTIDGTIGRLDTAIYPNGSDWISRRHYVLYQPLDPLIFQLGRFKVPYGINTPDHYAYIREGLSFNDQGQETYNLQGSWLTEGYNVIVSGSIGKPTDRQANLDSGADVTGSIMPTDHMKTGVSFHYGTNNLYNRQIVGPWGILGFTRWFTVLTEIDFQRKYPFNSNAQWGMADYFKADFEFIRGLHFFGTQELLRTNFASVNTLENRFGAAVDWFPRPHYEIEFMWQTQQNRAMDSAYRKILWLMLHFYP